MPSPRREPYDAVIVGAGHNGLVAATLLARAGWSVAVLERRGAVGGAAVSADLFPGTGVRLSRYAYLVSLFPRWLLAELGVHVELRRRAVSSYTPVGDGGILDRAGIGLPHLDGLSARLSTTFGQPLPDAEQVRALIGAEAFAALCERPLSELIETSFDDDVTRGLVATDALIGTFAPLDDAQLRQNRCFLYHVMGGPWDVPVGGMGALTDALRAQAAAAGAEIHTGCPVVAIDADAPSGACVHLDDGRELRTRQVLANVAPQVLNRLLGDADDGRPAPEGSQLKLNMVLTRLPRLRDPGVEAREAFAGTFHVNESYAQLNAAYARAAAGQLPDPVPCEAYCHSLTDPSIVPAELAARGGRDPDRVRAAHAYPPVPRSPPRRQPDRSRRSQVRRGGGDAGLDRLGAGRADRGLPGDRSLRRPDLSRGPYPGGARGGAGSAGRPHLPRRPELAVGRDPG